MNELLTCIAVAFIGFIFGALTMVDGMNDSTVKDCLNMNQIRINEFVFDCRLKPRAKEAGDVAAD